VSARVCFVVGARPNFMKSAPVYRELGALDPSLELTLLHTGQHYDDAMSDVFFRELAMPRPDEFLAVGSGSHAEQTAKALVGVERALRERQIDLCVVAGDVNSTLAGALAAVKLGIPIAHIESGLRSFDRAMPEEHNRVLTDHLSDLLLAHSEEAITNLQREGITSGVHLVGNTMIDSLVALEDRFRGLGACAGHGLEAGSYLLVTLHRPALVDGPLLDAAIAALAAVSESMPVLFPVHPRTRAALGGAAAGLPPGLQLTDPVGYLEFLSLEADARAVLTDSGGIQEEATYLGVPCFTLRDNTERPITVEHGTNRLLGLDPKRIEEVPGLVSEAAGTAPEPPPLWDGHAAERLARVVADRHAC